MTQHDSTKTGDVTIEGLRIHYREAGCGPVLLLLHGWPTHSGLYRAVIPELAKHRRVIALDFPGFGKSDKPIGDHRYGFAFYDRILDGFLAALDIADDAPVGLVIHDLGGPIGLHWAGRRTERLSELVVLNTLAFPELHWAVKAFVAALTLPGIRSFASSAFVVGKTMRLGVYDKARITPEVDRMYREVYETKSAQIALRKAGAELSPKGFARLRKTLEFVASHQVPTALIYGEHDRVLPDVARTMDRLQEMWPHASRTSFANAGHFLQEDVPAELAAELVAFVRRDARDSPHAAGAGAAAS